MSDPEYVAIEYAGHVTGVPARTLRRWAEAGKVPVMAGQRKRLVRLDDVKRLAEMTGHRPASPDMTGASAGQPAGHVADVVDGDDTTGATVVVSSAARAQLEAVRDEWLQPLIDQLRETERALGRTEAERDQARQERDALQERLAALEAMKTPDLSEFGQRTQDANRAPQRDDDRDRASESLDDPSWLQKPASDSLALRWRRWWRRVTGG